MNNIILAGSPNVGKTTLYNTLTKSNEKASNWHGVTVATKAKEYNFGGKKYTVTDLPGLYSLNGYSSEEKIASNYLRANRGDLVVNICDANNLKRNLGLTRELVSNHGNIILAVNMVNDFRGFDEEKLSKILGIPVIGIDARKNKSVDRLKSAISDFFDGKMQNFSQNIENFEKNIDKIDDFICKLNASKIKDISLRADKILTNKFLFFPFFAAVVLLVFFITFGSVGEFISGKFGDFVNVIFGKITEFIYALNMKEPIKAFLCDGVLSSLMTVFSFLPQIVLLMVSFNIIEETGVMSRFAFMLDGLMRKIGLTGKSLFSIMMGYGCTVSAILTTRNLESSELRKRTALFLPFSACSAKLPVFLVITSLFFDKYKYLFVLGFYLLSIIISVTVAAVHCKICGRNENVFVLEMPKYRLCYLKKIISDAIRTAVEFIYKIGTTILLFSIVIWLMQNFTIKLEYLGGENYTDSILYLISKSLALIFAPIGLGQAGIVSAIIFGLIAKELVVVGLSLALGVTGTEALTMALRTPNEICFFTKESSIIFLLFILIYSPCVSALSAIKSEFGAKLSTFVFVFQTVLSYLICLIVYNALTVPVFLKIIAALFFIAIFVGFVIQFRRKSCRGNCSACKKIQREGKF